jgi:protocatechuate 3,4-dioxygenase beta subunit
MRLTPALGRRRFLIINSAALVVAPTAFGQNAIPTPAQGEGPFYPPQLPPDVDNDLVQLRGSDAKAAGQVTHIRGRVLSRSGAPLAGAQLEIWQCDTNGRYLHPGSEGAKPYDAAFQGFGRATAAADGSYGFRTIKPVPYQNRAPHIHFAVAAPSARLITQMYVAGEADNMRDGLFRRLDARSQEALVVRLEAANGVETGALAGTFDIILDV